MNVLRQIWVVWILSFRFLSQNSFLLTVFQQENKSLVEKKMKLFLINESWNWTTCYVEKQLKCKTTYNWLLNSGFQDWIWENPAYVAHGEGCDFLLYNYIHIISFWSLTFIWNWQNNDELFKLTYFYHKARRLGLY